MSLLHSGSTASDGKLYPEDVFSTYLYTGNGTSQTINNGIDLATYGGIVWLKGRSATGNNVIFSNARGYTAYHYTNLVNAQYTDASITYNNNGFTTPSLSWSDINTTGNNYVSWTFRKAPKFFDVQTKVHTNGTASTIDLSVLGEVGMVLVKSTTTTSNWYTWHRSLTTGNNLKLNLTDAQSTTNACLSVSGTTLTISSATPSATYVIYAYAHDPSADGIIQCGSFVGNTTVTIGWEPQYIMIKRTDSTGDWITIDSMRGCSVGGVDARLMPNLSSAESVSNDYIDFTPTGFISKNLTGTYIYMVIRRPNKVPTSGTEVFKAITRTGTGATTTVTGVGFAPDLVLNAARNALSNNPQWFDRLRGATRYIISSATAAETTDTGSLTAFNMAGMSVGADTWTNTSGAPFINHFFKRAKGFFDVVCYTGDGTGSRNVVHSLGVAANLVIVKSRSTTTAWAANMGGFGYGVNFTGNAFTTSAASIYAANPDAATGTSTSFSAGEGSFSFGVNVSSVNYIAYLFASCPNVSKVGSYTGNGSTQTIPCGFSTGTRFVLIKRTDSTGDWYIWDTARGIVAANDPHLSLNTTAAEVTTDDSIDPVSSGFIVNQVAATNINVTSATYIFLAIA